MSTQSHSATKNTKPESEPVAETKSAPQRSRKSASAFRTISEVADELNVQQHVLRFWETKFSQIRPLKRGGGRRYYRPEDVSLLKGIHYLLYTEGYTIKGVQKLLKEQGKSKIIQNNIPETQETVTSQNGSGDLSDSHRTALEGMLDELKALRKMISPEE